MTRRDTKFAARFHQLLNRTVPTMGILTRKQGERFVVSSDRAGPGATNRAPRNVNDPYQVWTGLDWSSNIDTAVFFPSLDDADEYVRVNFPKLMT
jgi:hypothetical protein